MRLALILLLGITTFAGGIVLDRAGGDRQASREALTSARAELKQARQLAEEQQKKLEALPAQIKEVAMAVEAKHLTLGVAKEAEHKKALEADEKKRNDAEKKRTDAENLLSYARSQIGSLGAELKQTVSERNEWSAYARELEARLEKANIAFQNAAQLATLANLAAQRAALENQVAQQRAQALLQQQQRQQGRPAQESEGPSIEQQQRDLNEADLRMKKYLQQQDWNNTKRALNQSLNQNR